MQRPNVKLRRRLGVGKLTRRVLRLLRGDAEFPGSSIDQQQSAYAVAPVDISRDAHRAIRSATLDAERRRAKALMVWQKHRTIC